MKPTGDALQVFYGTIPLILVLGAHFVREQLLLQDILKRLTNLEAALAAFKDEVHKDFGSVKERLVALETRAGIIFHN